MTVDRAPRLVVRDRDPRTLHPRFREFFRAPLSTMVAPGLTTGVTARVAARTRWAGRHRVLVRDESGQDRIDRAVVPAVDLARSDGNFSFTLEGLEPDRGYTFFVESMESGARLGDGAFRTAPDRSRTRASVGLLSCHNPFDDSGELWPDALRALEVAPDTFAELGVSRVFLMGDQVYGDMPYPLSLFERDLFREIRPGRRESLFDCTRQEVRALYQERHRIFWKTDRFRELQARFACHPILDDHEIVDNFGSAPEHSTARWGAIRDGALDAFHDYQARRVFGDERPAQFDHGLRLGPLAIYVLDLRSNRRATHDRVDILDDAQLERLERFLDLHEDAPAVMLVLSVPILHVPDWMATVAAKASGEGSDAADRWSSARAQPSRDRLLELLVRRGREQPDQKWILAGGDIHAGTAMRFRLDGADRPVFQLVSSAISNRQGALHEAVAAALPQMRSVMGRDRGIYAEASLLEGGEGGGENPFGGLNFGVVDVDASSGEAAVRLRLFSHDDAVVPGARTVFDSGWL